MERLSVSRKKAYELLQSVRDITDKTVNLLEKVEVDANISKVDLEDDLLGVSNGFLSEVIEILTGYRVEVYGEVEELYACPCCGYKTLEEIYDSKEGTGYEICPYCFWEDDGTTDPDSYRSINKGCITDYRNKIQSNFNWYYRARWLKE